MVSQFHLTLISSNKISNVFRMCYESGHSHGAIPYLYVITVELSLCVCWRGLMFVRHACIIAGEALSVDKEGHCFVRMSGTYAALTGSCCAYITLYFPKSGGEVMLSACRNISVLSSGMQDHGAWQKGSPKHNIPVRQTALTEDICPSDCIYRRLLTLVMWTPEDSNLQEVPDSFRNMEIWAAIQLFTIFYVW
jgi:hypothetical protein